SFFLRCSLAPLTLPSFPTRRSSDLVLDAPARIDRLELRDDARTARLRKPVQANHRRVADQLQHRRRDLRSRRHMWYIARTALRRACARAARSPNVTRSTTSETALRSEEHTSELQSRVDL